MNNAIRYFAIFAASLLVSACADSAPADVAAKVGIGAPLCAAADCAKLGGFSPPFSEPTIDGSSPSPPEAPPNPLNERPGDDRCLYDESGRPIKCKPTAGSIAVLRDGRLLYFNALEGTERVEFSIFFEVGHALQNDQTRVMTLGDSAAWIKPSPNDGGANPDGQPPSSLLPPGTADTQSGRNNDGALFCADLAHLADGRVLAAGGTDYYSEPGIDEPLPFGVGELEGLKNARVFNPGDNTWRKTGDMSYGRWYPTLVSLASGDVMVASGVTKLVKPVYPDRLMQSGRNVAETETYDLCNGVWTDNGALAQRSLPLYPRLHLLPNGQVLYNAAGQAFNPFGQAYDQATWNFAAAYDPVSRTWADLAYAGMPSLATSPADAVALLPGAGFRGSTFSIMLPLKPDSGGNYTTAEFLTAGGVTGNVLFTSPGSNQATALARIDTVTVGTDNALSYASRPVGTLTAARWYGTGVLLPTGEVMTFSGADRDEVQMPGTGIPILRSERFDPASGRWSTMALQQQPRTYHNTAVLLPDARVLVGGHAPINTAYGYSVTIPGFSPNDGRDPSFEIYSPPYLFGPRPRITHAPAELRPGQDFVLTTRQAGTVNSVVLVRRTDLTHLVDADQRSVVLPILSRSGNALHLRMPRQKAVVPPGQYMLFINAPGPNGMAPSVSAPVSVPADRC